MDYQVAIAPRNDDEESMDCHSPKGFAMTIIEKWITTSLLLLVMTKGICHCERTKSLRSNPEILCLIKPMDCHVATAPRNDERNLSLRADVSPCEAIQEHYAL